MMTSVRLKAPLVQLLLALLLSVWGATAASYQSCGDLFRSAYPDGPRVVRVLAPAGGNRQKAVESLETLRFMSFNVENFFYHVGKWELVRGNTYRLVEPAESLEARANRNKDAEEREYIARIISDEIRADVVALQEVEGEASLNHFSLHDLRGQFDGFSIPGNDSRGIQVGSLIRRDLPLVVEMRSYRNRIWSDPSHAGAVERVFSRDAQVSVLSVHGASRPFLIKINVHNKSRRDRSGDKESTLKRTAQVEEVARIYRELQGEFGRDIPVVIMGDMNANVVSAPELVPLKQAGFVDAFELLNIPLAERVTHTYHPNGGPTHKEQIDGIFLSPSLHPYLIQAGVHRYRSDNGKGKVMPIPETYDMREKQPSDHFAVYMELETRELIRASLDPKAVHY